MDLRTITLDDLDQVCALYRQEEWPIYDEPLLRELISCSKWVGAFDGNKLMGIARYLTDGCLTIFLCEIITDPAYRRRGVGQALIDEIFKLYPRLRMDVVSDVDPFYENLGFRLLGNGYRRYASVDGRK